MIFSANKRRGYVLFLILGPSVSSTWREADLDGAPVL